MFASLMEVYGSPTVVRQKFAEQFAGRDPPSCLTIYRVYAKSVKTGSVADNYQGDAGQPRTLNIAVMQQAMSQSPSKSTTRCSLETDSAKNSVANLDTGPRDATVPHPSRPSFDSGAKACSRGMLPDFTQNDKYPTSHCESDGIQK